MVKAHLNFYDLLRTHFIIKLDVTNKKVVRVLNLGLLQFLVHFVIIYKPQYCKDTTALI